MTARNEDRHRVAVIGSGFGGLFATKALRRADVDVTVIDRTSHHLFQPLLYQVATGILSEGEIAPPTRDILRHQKDAKLLLGDVETIDLDAKTVTHSIRKDFRDFDKGSMATISRFRAVASIGRLHLRGFIAWVAWLAVHLLYLTAFKNRFTALVHWAVSFVGRGRSERTATQQQVFARTELMRLHRTRLEDRPSPGGESRSLEELSPGRSG